MIDLPRFAEMTDAALEKSLRRNCIGWLASQKDGDEIWKAARASMMFAALREMNDRMYLRAVQEPERPSLTVIQGGKRA